MSEVFMLDCSTGDTSTRPVTPEEQDQIDAANAEAETQRIADQRAEAEHVRVANTNETDWIITPPPDTEQNILNQIANNLSGWQTFRQSLRALPIQTIADPQDLVWPTHPVRPYTALTPQPEFVSGGGTP